MLIINIIFNEMSSEYLISKGGLKNRFMNLHWLERLPNPKLTNGSPPPLAFISGSVVSQAARYFGKDDEFIPTWITGVFGHRVATCLKIGKQGSASDRPHWAVYTATSSAADQCPQSPLPAPVPTRSGDGIVTSAAELTTCHPIRYSSRSDHHMGNRRGNACPNL